jgi:cytosolic carboxypeptidase protein 2/3
MFNRGMKVAVHSKQRYESEGVGWHRAGERISYFESTVKRDTCTEKSFYTLTFTYVFEHADDTVYFAYSVPYTYSDLRKDLLEIESDPRRA